MEVSFRLDIFINLYFFQAGTIFPNSSFEQTEQQETDNNIFGASGISMKGQVDNGVGTSNGCDEFFFLLFLVIMRQ